jgi:hypothetical protein
MCPVVLSPLLFTIQILIDPFLVGSHRVKANGATATVQGNNDVDMVHKPLMPRTVGEDVRLGIAYVMLERRKKHAAVDFGEPRIK